MSRRLRPLPPLPSRLGPVPPSAPASHSRQRSSTSRMFSGQYSSASAVSMYHPLFPEFPDNSRQLVVWWSGTPNADRVCSRQTVFLLRGVWSLVCRSGTFGTSRERNEHPLLAGASGRVAHRRTLVAYGSTLFDRSS